MKNESHIIEQRIEGFLEVEGIERPFAEKLIHWGIYTLGDFFRRPSLYLAELLGENQGDISRLQNAARAVMLEKGIGFD